MRGVALAAALSLGVISLSARSPFDELRAKLSSVEASAQPQPLPAAPLPLEAWTCPMHREVLEKQPGTCAICKMDLVPTRIEPAWTCPLHAAVIQDHAGKCPICQRELLPVTVEVAWVCPKHAEIRELEAGVCRLCTTTLVRTRSLRPHEDHTPKHGGIFFMAPDNWHHVEGTYPEPGVFRVFVYDNYSQPLDARQVTGRAVLKEEYDERTSAMREVVTIPLAASSDGRYLEARVGALAEPAEVTAKLTLKPGAMEDRFDFVFAQPTVEPTAVSGGGPAAGAPAVGPLAQLSIPENPELIASEIRARDRRLQELIGKGEFTSVFIPALEAKELGLALERHLEGLPDDRRAAAKLAVRRLVRAAWLLDSSGDLGDRRQVAEAYAMFTAAVHDLDKAYGK